MDINKPFNIIFKKMSTKKYEVKIIEFKKVKVVPDNGEYAGDDDYHMSEFITEWKLEIDGNPRRVRSVSYTHLTLPTKRIV